MIVLEQRREKSVHLQCVLYKYIFYQSFDKFALIFSKFKTGGSA